MLVASRSITDSFITGSIEDRFVVSRPLPKGSVIGQVTISYRLAGITIVDWVGSVGVSNEGSEAALRQGVPIISSGNIRRFGHAAYRVTATGVEFRSVTLFVGLRVESAPGFVVFVVSNGAAVGLEAITSIEILEEARPAKPALVPAEPGL